jgi:hypothetical protein
MAASVIVTLRHPATPFRLKGNGTRYKAYLAKNLNFLVLPAGKKA